MQPQSSTHFLIRIDMQAPVAGYLIFTFQRDRLDKNLFHILALRQNLEECGRDALIESITDFYFEQPGEAGRIDRHTVVAALAKCLST